MAHAKRPTRFSSKSNADFKKRLAAYNKHHRDAKIKATEPKPTEADKRDERKESELDNLLKNKPKGGYKDTSPKTENNTSSKTENKKRYAEPKPKPNTENKKKKDSLKTTGQGPVKSGKEYGKHLKEQSKKYQTTGKGPVKSGKEYGKTVKEHAAKKEAEEREKWLKDTRNSPAAKSRTHGKPTWSDEERWQMQKRHREWKASRKKKK